MNLLKKKSNIDFYKTNKIDNNLQEYRLIHPPPATSSYLSKSRDIRKSLVIDRNMSLFLSKGIGMNIFNRSAASSRHSSFRKDSSPN